MTNKPDRIRERAIDDSWGVPKSRKPLPSEGEPKGEEKYQGKTLQEKL
jgi:hypothetical protein